MIRSIPNPKMSREDVMRFRSSMRKCISGNFSVSEKEAINDKKTRMRLAEQIIRRNNGGKDPILGF